MMEQDKLLKEILMNSSEEASADFTNRVMKKVSSHSLFQPYYKPLISPKLQKAFLFAFGANIVIILGLCFIIAIGNVDVESWIQGISLPDVNYSHLLLFIIIFWLLFAINSLIEKYFKFRRRGLVNTIN